ncbi:hypothetical protein [Erinnyis ello granulovirus]|uniref:Uncharacterized protein n=1 Tax=Erinnyis ello granulovirus TaxID=307444 RepID=A0A097DAH1_9BBAC|nr:hypothetical protein [Erinnyis ello granulovirus]AIS92024.1 hypothetical protein [Erinnyis ello granulovirus]ARX71363.1 hypothetical protein EREL_024 [Erinnyis ello granulovirus]ARX71493.1 hypothetical protein EREL_024 [Erinnyis ello granulovirus]ARX71623.1 hypothetical protein EREL_024 [Erinnyis ello granulovirus]ARX71753.1 hypothetical protein EREL_024 [Erinnyis ello granulovirus]
MLVFNETFNCVRDSTHIRTRMFSRDNNYQADKVIKTINIIKAIRLSIEKQRLA